jgi:hypothetical protein
MPVVFGGGRTMTLEQQLRIREAAKRAVLKVARHLGATENNGLRALRVGVEEALALLVANVQAERPPGGRR